MDSNNPPKSSTIEDKLKLILHKLWKEDGDWKPAIEEIQAIITTETTKARLQEMELAHEAWLTTSLVDHMNKRLAQCTDLVATNSSQTEATQSRPVTGVQKEQKP